MMRHKLVLCRRLPFLMSDSPLKVHMVDKNIIITYVEAVRIFAIESKIFFSTFVNQVCRRNN